MAPSAAPVPKSTPVTAAAAASGGNKRDDDAPLWAALSDAAAERRFAEFGAIDGVLHVDRLVAGLGRLGIRLDNPRLGSTSALIASFGHEITFDQFKMLKHHDLFIDCALDGRLVMHDFPSFTDTLSAVYDEALHHEEGEVASYIPQLAKVDPSLFGVAVCTRDAQQWERGDTDYYFCVQSVSKAITYCMALEEFGEDYVHQHVGREPSGVGFNERVLNSDGLPHNPCINSGAIMCCSMVKPKEKLADRFDHVIDTWTRLCGGGRVTFGNSVYLSERASADRNFCLAYMMQEEGVFPEGTDLQTTLEFYFMLCSLEVNASMLAAIAGTLASGGVCPLTGERIFSERTVRNCLSVVGSCGMYDASGAFIFDQGYPTKSGVGGALLIVIPGRVGMCTFSPRLDPHGNSARGLLFCQALSQKLLFHQFAISPNRVTEPGGSYGTAEEFRQTAAGGDAIGTAATVHPLISETWFAAGRGDLRHLRYMFANGVDFSAYDYDRRSALGIAASEGHLDVVRYLVVHGADMKAKDRFGNTALDDAVREGHPEVAEYLRSKPKAVYTASDTEVVRLFGSLDDDGTGSIRIASVRDALCAAGFTRYDSLRRFRPLTKELKALEAKDGGRINAATLAHLCDVYPLVRRAVLNDVVLASFESLTKSIDKVYEEAMPNLSGKNASYIPELARVDPDQFAVSICSASGQLYSVGDAQTPFCVQSCTKIVNYLIAQSLVGSDKVHKHIGREPSGRNFNELCLDQEDKPHNPAINAGAIMCVSLLYPELSIADRFTKIVSVWAKLTGGSPVGFDNAVYLSERATASRNWTLAWMMKDYGAFPEGTDLQSTLDLYFMTCSLTATAEQLAIVSATLSCGGVNPLTQERVFDPVHTRNALSIMYSCGMYDYSGEFAFSMGIPAKSGVGGGIMAVVPERMGIGTWSPRLDKLGNSARGIDVLGRLTKLYNFHCYDILVRGKLDPSLHQGSTRDFQLNQLLMAASLDDVMEVRRLHSLGVNVSASDYDRRTALHVAVCDGALGVVRTLLDLKADPSVVDRWGRTPLDDAHERGNVAVSNILIAAGAVSGAGVKVKAINGKNAVAATTSPIVEKEAAKVDKVEKDEKKKKKRGGH
jgi:glutaminase